jgi:hypothetical protein
VIVFNLDILRDKFNKEKNANQKKVKKMTNVVFSRIASSQKLKQLFNKISK